MNRSIETNIRPINRLPLLKIVTARSTSAKLCSDQGLDGSVVEESTPYFKHYRNQSITFDNGEEGDLSLMCMKILQEQNELKQKINYQARMIQNIYKRKPPVAGKGLRFGSFMGQENKEITFKQSDWPSSARDERRFKFPRDVFTRKSTIRQS